MVIESYFGFLIIGRGSNRGIRILVCLITSLALAEPCIHRGRLKSQMSDESYSIARKRLLADQLVQVAVSHCRIAGEVDVNQAVVASCDCITVRLYTACR